MKKNFIRFNATQFGIECEGVAILSEEDVQKVEQNIKKIENAAKERGATLETVPKGIKLTFIIASSCDNKCIDEAGERMKCIIEEMREFITNLEIPHEQSPEKDVDENEAEFRNLFNNLCEKYPNTKIAVIGDSEDWTAVFSNMHPMHALRCMIEAIKAEYGENQ